MIEGTSTIFMPQVLENWKNQKGNPMDFQDQVVWVTGASSGIGEALALAFSKAGARVILSARSEGKLAQLAETCGGETRARALPLDLAAPETLPAAAEAARATWGRIDILVNNAGLSHRSTARETSMETVRRIMEVNFFAPVILTKAVLGGMVEQGGGRIVVVGSIIGKFGAPGRSSYGASKHALHGYFDALRAEEWRNGIRVTLVTPGYVRTNISVAAIGKDGHPHGKMDPGTEKGMSPERCAAVILRGVKKNREEILVGGRECMGVFCKRFAPGLLSRILRNAQVD